jgi:hypothetical protein
MERVAAERYARQFLIQHRQRLGCCHVNLVLGWVDRRHDFRDSDSLRERNTGQRKHNERPQRLDDLRRDVTLKARLPV